VEETIKPIYKKCDKTVIIIEVSLTYQLPTEIYLTFFCGFRRSKSTNDQILYIRHTLQKKGSSIGKFIIYL